MLTRCRKTAARSLTGLSGPRLQRCAPDRATDVRRLSEGRPRLPHLKHFRFAPAPEFISATSGGIFEPATNEVVWIQGSIPAEDKVNDSFIVEVDSPLANGTLITSASSAVSAESLPVSAQATVTVSSAPLLLLGKT